MDNDQNAMEVLELYGMIDIIFAGLNILGSLSNRVDRSQL